MQGNIVFVDVDDTLIRSVGAKRIPMPAVVEQVRELKKQGAMLYLWSSGGAAYAESSAKELGLTDCFIGFLPKPHTYIDDQPVNEWRFCRHLYPSQASDAL
jgi:hydroxymethylpyrimidine pyrophosphatase-like HAD family hydrolase